MSEDTSVPSLIQQVDCRDQTIEEQKKKIEILLGELKAELGNKVQLLNQIITLQKENLELRSLITGLNSQTVSNEIEKINLKIQNLS